jgi:hypothetical protein
MFRRMRQEAVDMEAPGKVPNHSCLEVRVEPGLISQSEVYYPQGESYMRLSETEEPKTTYTVSRKTFWIVIIVVIVIAAVIGGAVGGAQHNR